MATIINPHLHFGLAQALHAGSPTGVLVYVNSAAAGGDDANDGLVPSRPKLTIGSASGAISLCTDDDDTADTIIVQGVPDETFPITIDVARVSVIGVPAAGFYPRLRLDARTAVEDVFVIESNYALVKGFELRAGAAHAGIAIDAANVHRCRFTDLYFGYGAYGVHYVGTGGGGHQVDRSYFQGSLTDGGVFNYSNAYQLKINDNVFGEMPLVAAAILVHRACGDGQILDNTFALPSNTDGTAITLAPVGGTPDQWIIAGNRANYGLTTMGNNPYRDLCGAGRNHWMQNWRGNALTDPAVA